MTSFRVKWNRFTSILFSTRNLNTTNWGFANETIMIQLAVEIFVHNSYVQSVAIVIVSFV